MRSAIFGLTLQLLVGAAGAWAGPPTEIAKQVIEKALDISQRSRLPGQRHGARRSSASWTRTSITRKWPSGPWDPPGANSAPASGRSLCALFSQLLEASYSDKIEKYAQRVKIDYTGEILRAAIRRSAHRGGEGQ